MQANILSIGCDTYVIEINYSGTLIKCAESDNNVTLSHITSVLCYCKVEFAERFTKAYALPKNIQGRL